MIAIILLTVSQPQIANISFGYIVGALIAMFILVYLLYTLVKPEKF